MIALFITTFLIPLNTCHAQTSVLSIPCHLLQRVLFQGSSLGLLLNARLFETWFVRMSNIAETHGGERWVIQVLPAGVATPAASGRSGLTSRKWPAGKRKFIQRILTINSSINTWDEYFIFTTAQEDMWPLPCVFDSKLTYERILIELSGNVGNRTRNRFVEIPVRLWLLIIQRSKAHGPLTKNAGAPLLLVFKWFMLKASLAVHTLT